MHKKLLTFLPLAVFFILLFAPKMILATYTVEIPIGTAATTFTLPEYIVTIHKFGTAIAGIVAVIMMMIGGFIWLSSAGNSGQISTGKGLITGAIIGLVIVFFSYFMLYFINPRLVNLSVDIPKTISGGDKVCCEINGKDSILFETECEWKDGISHSTSWCTADCETLTSQTDCDQYGNCVYLNNKCEKISGVACTSITTEQKCKDAMANCIYKDGGCKTITSFSCSSFDVTIVEESTACGNSPRCKIDYDHNTCINR